MPLPRKVAEPSPSRLLSKRGEVFFDLQRDGFTFSMLDTFLCCPEKHRLRAVEGLTNRKFSDALGHGIVFHNAHDMLYTKASLGELNLKRLSEEVDLIMSDLLERDLENMRKVLAGPEAEESYEMTHAQVHLVMQAYAKNWKTDFTSFEWVGLEEKFDIPYEIRLPDGRSVVLRCRGKRDGRFRQKKKTYLFETKTKAQIEDSSIADKMAWDLQPMLYSLMMWKEFKEVPAGILYNLVRRPLLRQGQKETYEKFLQRIEEDLAKRPEHYFYRLNVALTKQDILDWEPTFRDMVTQLWRWHQGEFHYRNSAQCKGQYGACEFLPVCHNGDRGRFVQRLSVFPELEG